MPRSQYEKENVQLVQELAEVDGPFESPINLNFRDLIKLELPSLTWNKPDSVPKKMKVTNTGHTVIISGKWKCERPYLTGGPLDGKYVFSQIHFHWGPDNCKGSEHQVCGESFPLEMHVAHFKTEYLTQESALREKDGMVVLVYLFKLQEEPNNSLKKIINALPSIRQANTSQPLECRSILALCNPFTDDYFMYWGSVVTSTCAHILLWIVCREPFGISREQMEEFRKICDSSQHPIRRNSREPQPLHKRNVFHVNASRHVDEPLLPIKNILGCFCYPASDGNGRDEKKSEGDGGCNCNSNGRPQEELEGSQDPGSRQDVELSRGNGVYLQQTVYYQHATVHSVPALPRRYDDPLVRTEDECERRFPEVQGMSQSCCFLSIEEEKSMSEDKNPRERTKERRRKPIDSVTTLANLIETLETLKTQTYKKLKEIESINHEIRSMKSSCENLEERHWLRHAEKIMSRQKRFTIRSSQCCFSELKKLAKECNFDKLLDDKIITGGEESKLFLSNTEATDSALICSNASGDKIELHGLEKIESAPFNFCKSERFSRKAQKLIRSFFEDIKESEETQLNLERNLLLKKFEKLSKRKSEISDTSSLNIPLGQLYLTKNMMNMGRIREQFFMDVPAEEKAITSTETKMVPVGKKKKNRSFFKLSLNNFDNSKTGASKKGQKRSLFSKSALSWLNNRLNTIHDTSPVIPLRIADIELKGGNVSSKKKSKHSIKSTSIRKVVSDDHIRTEVSSYLSESFISEFSDKQSRISKQSRAQTRSIMRGFERSSETRKKSEMSIMRVVNDVDVNNFFVQLSNSANISSATSTDSERRDTKFIKRKSRKDIWEKGSSTISGFRKEVNSTREIYYDEVQDLQCISSVTGNVIEKRISTSSDSSIMIKKQSKREIFFVTSSQPSKVEMLRSRDVSVDATEEKSVNSPKRKKLRLEWKSRHYEGLLKDVNEIAYTETESHKEDNADSECEAHITNKPVEIDSTPTYNQEKIIQITDISAKTSLEKLDNMTESVASRGPNENESQTETEKESIEISPRQLIRDSSVEANIALPTLPEITDKLMTEALKATLNSENEASEVSFSPRRSSDTLSEPAKDFSFEIKRTVVLDSPKQPYWIQEDKRYTSEANTLSEQEAENQQSETFKEEESGTRPINEEDQESLTKTETCPQETRELDHSGNFDDTDPSIPNELPEKKTKNDPPKEPEFKKLFTVQELGKSTDVTRDVSQNDLSECNEYDLQTDSNGTMNYNQQKEMRSRDTTPSIPSSEDEKNRETSIATGSSILRINSQQKPFSAESFNSFKNAYEAKQRKKRQCIKKKSKQLLRKNNSMIRKLNKIGGSNLDFTNLTEEEQLKIISANVARFVKQKLVEHKQFFDFEKNEPMTFDVEQWSKSAEQGLMDGRQIIEPAPEFLQAQEVKEKEPAQPKETVPSPQRPPTPPVPKEETKEEPQPTPEPTPEVVQVTENQAPSVGGDTEKDEKNDAGRQTLDFIKLNKIMAGKYKRRCAPEPPKKGKKAVKKETEVKKEPAKPIAPKSLSANNESESAQKLNESPPKTTETPPPSPPKVEAPPRPETAKLPFGNPSGRGIRAPSADGARRGGSLQRGHKSDIPVPQTGLQRTGKVTARSASATPTPTKIATPRTTPTPPLALQKPKIPKKRLVPTYTLTSYLSAPNEIIEYQQRDLDKYLAQGNDFTDFFIEGSKSKKYQRKKNRDPLSKKNLDYLIMLQKRINHEISANIENSMNYVKTLLSQDYNGTAIIEKAPVKNSLDVFEPGNGGVVFIEMNDQFECSSSGSEYSEESGFYCIYQGRNRRERNNRKVKREIFVKRNESGDSGLVDPRLFEELQNDTDSSYNCEVSIVVNPKAQEDPFHEKYGPEEASDALRKYIYHLGGGEESDYFCSESLTFDEKKPLKKRKERILDIPKEMKRKLLDLLEDETKAQLPPAGGSDHEESSEGSVKNDAELESVEIISKISEMVKQYLDEYDRKHKTQDGRDELPQEP